MTNTSIRPGQIWLDTKGERIQAHGGSLLYENETFYRYGENKEKSTPGSGIRHWGVRAYSSRDLYNWDDLGLIIPPVVDDRRSPLYPSQKMDRPHIILSKLTGEYVAWLKATGEGSHDTHATTILTADSFLGPYEIVRERLEPLGMSAGDFDSVFDRSALARHVGVHRLLPEFLGIRQRSRLSRTLAGAR